MSTFTVREADGDADITEVRRLVTAHADARADVPGVEHVYADAARMPGPYSGPRGGIWIAATESGVIGCVALKPLTNDTAEVKRMFVEAEWRGRGAGRALMSALIEAARERGFSVLRLGTLSDMHPALGLYRSMGFTAIERYRFDELIDTRFFELHLS